VLLRLFAHGRYADFSHFLYVKAIQFEECRGISIYSDEQACRGDFQTSPSYPLSLIF